MVWAPGSVLLCALLMAPQRLWLACLLASTLSVVVVLSAFALPVTALTAIAFGDFQVGSETAGVLTRTRSAAQAVAQCLAHNTSIAAGSAAGQLRLRCRRLRSTF